MNLFDLPGPQFLGLYIALAIAVTYGLWWKRRQLELQATAVPRLDDPYQLAMLRKGPREVAGLAMLTLIDRKLIVLSGTDKLMRASGVTPAHAEHPIEKAALQILDSPESVGLVESGLKAGSGPRILSGKARSHRPTARTRTEPSSLGALDCRLRSLARRRRRQGCNRIVALASGGVLDRQLRVLCLRDAQGVFPAADGSRRRGRGSYGGAFLVLETTNRLAPTGPKRVDVVRRGVRPRTDPQEHHAQLVAAVSKTTAIVELLGRRRLWWRGVRRRVRRLQRVRSTREIREIGDS